MGEEGGSKLGNSAAIVIGRLTCGSCLSGITMLVLSLILCHLLLLLLLGDREGRKWNRVEK